MVKKLALSSIAIALVSSLVGMATFALLGAHSPYAGRTFSSGSVTLGVPTTNITDISGLSPGDSSSFTYAVEYTGTMQAWLGLQTSLTGPLASGATPLQLTVTEGSTTYNPNSGSVMQVIGRVSAGVSKTFTIQYTLPREAGPAYQGLSAQFSLTVRAVQTANNTNTAGTGPVDWN